MGNQVAMQAVVNTSPTRRLSQNAAKLEMFNPDGTKFDLSALTRPTLATKTADYTFVLGDAWNRVFLSGATGKTFTVPPNSSVAFPVGTEIKVGELGSGALTIAQGAGVTVTVKAAQTRVLNGASSVASLLKTDTDTWLLTGDLVAA